MSPPSEPQIGWQIASCICPFEQSTPAQTPIGTWLTESLQVQSTRLVPPEHEGLDVHAAPVGAPCSAHRAVQAALRASVDPQSTGEHALISAPSPHEQTSPVVGTDGAQEKA
jgi:hypothetical protein